MYLRIEPGEFDGNLLWPSNLKVGVISFIQMATTIYTTKKSIMLKLFPNEYYGWNDYNYFWQGLG